MVWNMLLNCFVLMEGENGWKEVVWAGKMLLPALCLIKREREGDEDAFLTYMECVRPWKKAREAPRFVCLHRSTID